MSQPTAQSFTVAQLCQQLGLPVPTQGGGLVLTGVQPLGLAGPTHLSFFDNQMYKEGARTTAAGAVLVRPADAEILPPTCAAILAPQPYMALAQALQLLYPTPELVGGISQFAVVSSSATVHPTARVEPYAVIYAEAHIEAGAHIGAHAVIGSGCVVGAGSRVGAHVTLHKTTLGERCLIHPGARLGQDGFGFAVHQDKILKIPQIGRVMVGNEVEIGANSTIDCGALGDTLIHDHAKIDNQVQIAHNVVIGRGSRIVAQVGIAGSAQLGEFTVIGGQSGISGHTTLANRVMVAARSGVTKSISVVGQVVGGFPAVPMAEWRKSMAMLARLSKGLVPNKALPTAPAAPANPNTANPFA